METAVCSRDPYDPSMSRPAVRDTFCIDRSADNANVLPRAIRSIVVAIQGDGTENTEEIFVCNILGSLSSHAY